MISSFLKKRESSLKYPVSFIYGKFILVTSRKKKGKFQISNWILQSYILKKVPLTFASKYLSSTHVYIFTAYNQGEMTIIFNLNYTKYWCHYICPAPLQNLLQQAFYSSCRVEVYCKTQTGLYHILTLNPQWIPGVSRLNT